MPGKNKIYIFPFRPTGKVEPIEAVVTTGCDVFTLADDGKECELPPNGFNTSFMIDDIVASPEIVRFVKDMTDGCFFQRKEIKRMRHFVTHGHDILLKYQAPDGRQVIEQARTPRELRLLLDKTHRVRTGWCAERKNNYR